MKEEQRKRLKKLEAENQGVMARVMEGMSSDWRLKYLDTLEEVGQLYLALKGIYVESENFDPKSSEANQMRNEFLSLYMGEMMNRKSSGLKSEKEYKNKFEKLYAEGGASAVSPDPFDLARLSIAYLADMLKIIYRSDKDNDSIINCQNKMHASLGKAQYWVGSLRGLMVGRDEDSVSINASKASRVSHAEHYKIRDAIQSWWLENRDEYPTQEKAALAAMALFGTTFETTRRHISKKSQELRGKRKK